MTLDINTYKYKDLQVRISPAYFPTTLSKVISEQTLGQILSVPSLGVCAMFGPTSRTNIEPNTERSVAQCLCNIWLSGQEQTLTQILSVRSLSVCAMFGPPRSEQRLGTLRQPPMCTSGDFCDGSLVQHR
jgi:hypothetical protein